MKHSLHPQRLILAVLLLAALVSSVCAAEVRIGKDSIYCFSADDFADPARGIYVDAVPSASTGTLCYGDRVLCAGDVLPVAALGEIEFRPACAEETDCALTYRAITDSGLGAVETLKLQLVSKKDTTPGLHGRADGNVQEHRQHRRARGLGRGRRCADLSDRPRAEARQRRTRGRRQLHLHASAQQGRPRQLCLHGDRPGGQRLQRGARENQDRQAHRRRHLCRPGRRSPRIPRDGTEGHGRLRRRQIAGSSASPRTRRSRAANFSSWPCACSAWSRTPPC